MLKLVCRQLVWGTPSALGKIYTSPLELSLYYENYSIKSYF